MANHKTVRTKFKGTVPSVGLLPLIQDKRKGDYAFVEGIEEFWMYIGDRRWEQRITALCPKCGKSRTKTVKAAKLHKLDIKDKSRAWITERLEAKGYIVDDTDIMLMDGHDNAFVDIVERFGSQPYAAYSLKRVIANLTRDFRPQALEDLMLSNPGSTRKELATQVDMEAETMAWDWYHFNMIGAWVGEGTPGFLNDI